MRMSYQCSGVTRAGVRCRGRVPRRGGMCGFCRPPPAAKPAMPAVGICEPPSEPAKCAELEAEIKRMEQELPRADRKVVAKLHNYHNCNLRGNDGDPEAAWEEYKAACAARDRLRLLLMMSFDELERERKRQPGRRGGPVQSPS